MKRTRSIGVALTLMAGYCSLLFAEEQLTQLEVITDMEQKARLDFHQAVTLQLMASSPSPKNPKLQLEQATRLYFAYLEQYPQSSATKNNLAKVFESLGDLSKQRSSTGQDNGYYDIAVGFYKEAIKANDSNKGLYLKNHADFLERTGDWESAKENYARMIKGYPISPTLQQTLKESYRQHGHGDLAEYLWTLQSAGYITESANIALEALLQSSNKRDKSRIELLTIVCTALSEGIENRESFRKSAIGGHIATLTTDSFLGEGADEIIRLHHGRKFVPEDYSWWAGLEIPQEDPAIGVWPTDGFRALIRFLGIQSRYMGDQDLAESYFLLAVKLQEQDIDPDALSALALMYAEENEFEKIDSLMEFQDRLKPSNAEAYRVSREKKISQNHRTIGELYALVQNWGSGSKSEKDSAIFQIELAIKMSKKIDKKPLGHSPEYPLHYDPGLIDTLATGYAKTDNNEKSVNLRFETAELYKRAGIEEAMEYMLEPLDIDGLTRAQERVYRTLKISDGQEEYPDSEEMEEDSGSTECIYSDCTLVNNPEPPERLPPLQPPLTNPPGQR